jgi:curved DNA-binding protein CbpA
VSLDDYYKILGVDRTENVEGIHTAYRRLAKQCHPDVAGIQSKEKFQGIQQAYEVLSDPDKRKHYDATFDKRPRMRGKRAIEPEPLVPSSYPSWAIDPEPLIRESVPIEEIFSSSSSRCSYCNSFKSSVRDVCAFCQAFEPMKDDILQFVMRSFPWFRAERF